MPILTEHADYIIGIDPDRDKITAAIVVTTTGAVVATDQFQTTAADYRKLPCWADRHLGEATRVWSIEGANMFGAGAAATLQEAGETVVEFDHPSSPPSKDRSKNDTLDAIRAARETAGRDKHSTPRSGAQRQQIQALTVARDGAQRSRVAAINELKALIVTAPIALREALRSLTHGKLIDRCCGFRASTTTTDTRLALRSIARRVRQLETEIAELDELTKPLVDDMAPQLLDEFGINYTTAAQILVAWSHPGRVRSEAAFARLAGVAPREASSGLNTRHRLSRGGDRKLNRAIHQVMHTRVCFDPETKAYIERRVAEGKTPREAKRCLKRYIARHIWRILENPPEQT